MSEGVPSCWSEIGFHVSSFHSGLSFWTVIVIILVFLYARRTLSIRGSCSAPCRGLSSWQTQAAPLSTSQLHGFCPSASLGFSELIVAGLKVALRAQHKALVIVWQALSTVHLFLLNLSSPLLLLQHVAGWPTHSAGRGLCMCIWGNNSFSHDLLLLFQRDACYLFLQDLKKIKCTK